MAKEELITGMKTAGLVVAAAVMSFGACSQKEKNTVSPQDAMYKADSAAKANPSYKNTLNAIELYEAQIQKYKEANKNMLRYYAKIHIRQNIKSEQLRNLLLTCMDEDILMEVSGLEVDDAVRESSDYGLNDIKTLSFFRRNNPWYNALLLYLSDKYTEEEFLKSNFFNMIKDGKRIKETFMCNATEVKRLQEVVKIAANRSQTIVDGCWKQYSQKGR